MTTAAPKNAIATGRTCRLTSIMAATRTSSGKRLRRPRSEPEVAGGEGQAAELAQRLRHGR